MQTCKEIWEADLNITVQNWERLTLDNWYLTTSTKLRYFQYKVMNRILTTNLRRAKWDDNVVLVKTYRQSRNADAASLHWQPC